MKASLALIGIACFGIALSMAPFAAADIDDSEIINPNWVKPGHYHHDYHPEEASCPTPVVEECICPILPDWDQDQENLRLAFVHYRKLVRRLFDERRLQVNSDDELFMVRNIQFKISKRQVENLKKARTANEIDDVVIEIVEQSKESDYYAVAESACNNLYYIIVGILHNKVLLYCVVPALVIIVILAISKRFHMRWWFSALLCLLIGSYIMTYRDCNDRLELQSLIKLMKREGEESNPCNKLSSWFSSGAEAECVDYLQNVHGLKRTFCDPSEVAMEMLARLPMKYLGTIVDETNHIMDSVSSKFGWTRSIVIGMFIPVLLCTMVTVCIKYSLIAGFKYWKHDRLEPRPVESIQGGGMPQQLPQQPVNVNIINYTRPRRTTSRIEPTPSRVEEISDGAQPKTLIAPPSPAKTVANVEEHGSGDGYVAATMTAPTLIEDSDECSSEIDDIILIEGQFPEEIRQAIDENQRSKSKDQSSAS